MSEQRVQIDPMAAFKEKLALIGWYEDRTLFLANQVHVLTKSVEDAQALILDLQKQIEGHAPASAQTTPKAGKVN